VFDVTNSSSFDSVTSKWVHNLREHAKSNVIKMLVGNKVDSESNRMVTSDAAQRVADTHSMSYVETSAKTGNNVQQAFFKLIGQILV
jgi:GTPase SAR1 family protein